MLALAVLYIKSTAPEYEIKSQVLIKDAKKGMSSDLSMLSDLSGLGGMSTNSIDNEVEVFKTKKATLSTLYKAYFQVDGEYRGRIKSLSAQIKPGVLQLVLPKPAAENA